jgi:hypothetical protein
MCSLRGFVERGPNDERAPGGPLTSIAAARISNIPRKRCTATTNKGCRSRALAGEASSSRRHRRSNRDRKPRPYDIPKYPMTTMKAALRKATVFEAIAAVVLYEPATTAIGAAAAKLPPPRGPAPRLGPPPPLPNPPPWPPPPPSPIPTPPPPPMRTSLTESVWSVPMRFFAAFGAADAGP